MPTLDPLFERMDYSLRRYFIDEFYFRHVPKLPSRSRVLDLGGNKIRKRGQFDIGRYNLRVVYANLSNAKQPDVLADAADVPFRGGCFDAVICSELVEHVPDPLAVLHEAYRVLREGGTLLISVPFLFRIHGDPYDYGRYTGFYWSKMLTMIGFDDVSIEKQGLFWSVLVDMLRDVAYQMAKEGQLRSTWLRRQVGRVIGWSRKMALRWEAKPDRQQHPFFGSFTTGFGIQATK